MVKLLFAVRRGDREVVTLVDDDLSSEGMTISRRRPRDRGATEQALLRAARELLERDGPLAGISLNEVATRAGVNRGLIYQYFGSRRQLLLATLKAMSEERASAADGHFEKPFPEQRATVFKEALNRSTEIRLETLLALEGELDLGIFPRLEDARKTWIRDKETGVLPVDADVESLHVLTASMYLGYVIFRDAFAQELESFPRDLDQRVLSSFKSLLKMEPDGSE